MKPLFLASVFVLGAAMAFSPAVALADSASYGNLSLTLTVQGTDAAGQLPGGTKPKALLSMKNTSTSDPLMLFYTTKCQFTYKIVTDAGKTVESKTLCEPEYATLRLKPQQGEDYYVQATKKLKPGAYTLQVDVAGQGTVSTPFTVTSKKSASKASLELEPSVYVTPGGVRVIRQPKGWIRGPILADKNPEAGVFFTNPDGTVTLQVGVGIPMAESANPLAQADRLIKMYTGSGKVDGKKLSGSLVSEDAITLGAASGYRVEIKRTDLSGKWRIVESVVATSGPDYYYTVSAKVPEKEWKKSKPLIESAFRTLQVPQK